MAIPTADCSPHRAAMYGDCRPHAADESVARRIRLRVAVIEDEPDLLDLMRDWLVERLPGATLECADTLAHARELLRQTPLDLAIVDIGLPDGTGCEFIEELLAANPACQVIIVSGTNSVHLVLQAFQLGIYDFVQKPVDFGRFELVLRRVVDHIALRQENADLREQLLEPLPGLRGNSAAIRDVARIVRLIAPRDTTVLVHGESGTGKECIARAIHGLSPRSSGPFVAFNAAAVPESLFEAECFGLARNSGVAGAPPEGRPGLFESAQGGTLFLDEIGDMSQGAQAKVLRVLQEKEVLRIGSVKPVPIDVRVVCATHKDLVHEAEVGNFRRDLYFRLSTFPIYLPPLRDRPEDIADLAHSFLQKHGGTKRMFSAGAVELMRNMRWEGNVRELQAFVERLDIVCNSEIIGADDVRREASATNRFNLASIKQVTAETFVGELRDFASTMDEAELGYLSRLVRDCGWNVTLAAERSGLSRAYLHRLLRKHGIQRPGTIGGQ